VPTSGSSDLACARFHVRVAWWTLLAFLTMGIALESLHAFKIGWYLDVRNETRRLMLTLAHAHGTLLSLIHLGFGYTLTMLPGWQSRTRAIASWGLLAAGVLLPGGFLLGGAIGWSKDTGDPGLGILLVPVGAGSLFVAVLVIAREVQMLSSTRTDQESD
jgi:hypothetical protein